MGTPATFIPAHVPKNLVVDFDYFAPEGAAVDPFLALKKLQQAPGFFWTPRHGGHWVATQGDDIKAILADHQKFSSRAVFIPVIERPRLVPVEQDPPEHTEYRRVMMPAFAPDAVERYLAPARDLAIELIEGFYTKGECEFILSFGVKLPMLIFMKMCDLPLADYDLLLKNANDNSRGDSATRAHAWHEIAAYVSKIIQERRARPGDDAISNALQAKVFGRPVDDQEAFGIVNAYLGGGFDTVQAAMGWVAKFLAESPTHRKQLVDNPALIPRAIDEMLRRFPITNIARVVRDDIDYKGVSMRAGEQILLPTALYSFDEHIYRDALKVDFLRPDAKMHMTFSNGVHKCPGQNLAIGQLKVFLEEWLKRIPDFRIKPGTQPVTGTGIVHGVTEMWLEWDAR